RGSAPSPPRTPTRPARGGPAGGPSTPTGGERPWARGDRPCNRAGPGDEEGTRRTDQDRFVGTGGHRADRGPPADTSGRVRVGPPSRPVRRRTTSERAKAVAKLGMLAPRAESNRGNGRGSQTWKSVPSAATHPDA